MSCSPVGVARVILMNFAFTEEQEELRKTVRALPRRQASEEAVREQMDTETGYDDAVWARWAEQMGLQGLAIPEEYGGRATASSSSVIVLEEMGRCPAVCTVLLDACARCEHPAAFRVTTLPNRRTSRASHRVTPRPVAFTEPNGKWDESGITRATRSERRSRLSGTKSFVLDGTPPT